MIPQSITQYLQHHHVPFERRWHPRAISAQMLAAALHVTGFQVAKSVIIRADTGELWIAVCCAPDIIDTEKLADIIGVQRVRLADESEFADRFRDCELGAEPPFGHLYGMPVVIDESMCDAGKLLFRAGSHEEAIEMNIEDFTQLEEPIIGSFIEKRPGQATYAPTMEMHP